MEAVLVTETPQEAVLVTETAREVAAPARARMVLVPRRIAERPAGVNPRPPPRERRPPAADVRQG
ncbi:MAG TPA: hypothetical protein VF444_22510 [Pseudonocardiaceae bacterium]